MTAKNILLLLTALFMFLGLTASAHAELINRGTDTLGNRLIYDSDLNITWYDYTNIGNTWQNQMSWASVLTVNFDGTIFDDWRLPTTVDGPWVYGYDGTPTGGYNITTSEMGHLFYTELGNKGKYDTAGNPTGCYPGTSPWCLTNKGNFQNFQPLNYWMGTEYAATPDYLLTFDTSDGIQGIHHEGDGNYYAIAVRPGDVAVPEPASLILLGTGLVGIIGLKRRLKK